MISWALAVSLHRDREGRSAREKPRWPNGSARGWTRRSCGKKPRTRFSSTSTPTNQGRRCRRSCSVFSTAPAQTSLQQADLFSQTTICEYLFDKDKIFAYLNLDDNELSSTRRFIRPARGRDVPPPISSLSPGADRRPPAPVHSRRMDAEAVALSLPTTSSARAERGVPPFLLHYPSTPLVGRRNRRSSIRTPATKRWTI